MIRCNESWKYTLAWESFFSFYEGIASLIATNNRIECLYLTLVMVSMKLTLNLFLKVFILFAAILQYFWYYFCYRFSKNSKVYSQAQKLPKISILPRSGLHQLISARSVKVLIFLLIFESMYLWFVVFSYLTQRTKIFLWTVTQNIKRE